MMFRHTSREKGMWRGWFKNGQALELNWNRSYWDFGAGVLIHSNDADTGDRMLCLKLWRWSAYIPLGVVPHPWPAMDGPQWSAFASKEFGMTFHWGSHRKSFDWPWNWYTLAYETQLHDGSWRELDWSERQDQAKTETHSYIYALQNGTVQFRRATISKRRHIITWRAFKALGWPRWIKESIDIEFNKEVGERSGSWKGGCIGCSYDLLPDETMLDALRRMEKERVFK